MWRRLATVLSNKKVMIRLAITLALLFVFRFVSHIPVPLIDVESIAEAIGQQGAFLAIMNNFTGGALGRFSVLALGISPYITASIVFQLLQMVIPAVKEWADQGEEGKQKVNRYTRYLAIVLAFVQGLVLLLGFDPSGTGNRLVWEIITSNVFGLYLYISLIFAAGTAFTIWLADLITKRGIGNGTSLLIAIGITSSLPTMFSELGREYLGNGFGQTMIFVAVIVLYLAILLGVVYLQIAKRKIPIQYANRQAQQGGQGANIPIQLNSAGVIPVIFASTIMSIPLTFGQVFNKASEGGWLDQIFSSNKPIGFVVYVVLIIVFSFFYSFMSIDPEQIADNLSKSNAYIKGIRPGEDTKNYIARVLFKVTVIGTLYLVVLAIIPILGVAAGLPQSVTLGGTGLLIIVGVATETTQQIETDAEQTQYHGVLNR